MTGFTGKRHKIEINSLANFRADPTYRRLRSRIGEQLRERGFLCFLQDNTELRNEIARRAGVGTRHENLPQPKSPNEAADDKSSPNCPAQGHYPRGNGS